MKVPLNIQNIRLAAKIIRDGGLCAFPTETVYGLGCDAFNPAALAKVFEVKNRPFFDPLILHIAEADAAGRLADLSRLNRNLRPVFEKLLQTLMPGPLTLVLPKRKEVPDLATGGLDTVALRFPAHEGAQALIREAGVPVAAPSANPFGFLSPVCAEDVEEQLGGKISLILDGGRCQVGLESTVLDLSGDRERILRPGGVCPEEIEAVTGKKIPVVNHSGADGGSVSAPGQLKSHYAPKTVLCLFDLPELLETRPREDTAWLFFDEKSFVLWQKADGLPRREVPAGALPPNVFILSRSGDPVEAASRLFMLLHKIDRENYKIIFAQKAPGAGLGLAINDRLTRASTKRNASSPGRAT